ncbi:MAG: thymidine phosphorylase [Candidatus Woesearchaeota archaeon]
MKASFYVLDIFSNTNVLFLPRDIARDLGLSEEDKVVVRCNGKSVVCVVNITNFDKIYVSKNVVQELNVKNHFKGTLNVLEKPLAMTYIRKKLDGYTLNAKEIDEVIRAIVCDEVGSVEKTFFIAGSYFYGLSDQEIVDMIKSIVKYGKKISFNGIVVDKHCAGGVPGNRTTMIVVPIVAALNLKIPKTSSRSITSPAGTADVMEVLCKVDFDVDTVKEIVKKTSGCIVWGGGVNLAPADDKLIKIRQVLNLDPKGLLLVSILAKKYAVGSKYVLIDLPVGKGAKFTYEEGLDLANYFIKIGKMLNLNIKVVLSDGTQPIGNGIGPALEAIDVLKVLRQEKDLPKDLEQKALDLAGILLDMIGIRKYNRSGRELAEFILKSGMAYQKMKEIIQVQQGNIFEPKQIENRLGRFRYVFKSPRKGIIKSIDNRKLSELCKIVGNPFDKFAGIYLFKHVSDQVKENEPILQIYSSSEEKLKNAIDRLKFYQEKKDFVIEIQYKNGS